MGRTVTGKALVLFLLAVTFGCSAPPMPPEVKLSEEQENNLWRLGAQAYAPAGYDRYKIAFRRAKEALIQEQSKFSWFQDYRHVQSELRDVLTAGYALQKEIIEQKNIRKESAANQLSSLKSRIEALKNLTETINEGRLARKDLVKAELLVSEAAKRYENGDYEAAEVKLKTSSGFIKTAEETILPILIRYADRRHISKWRRLAEETILESRNAGVPVIIVNKSQRTLMLYKNGVPFKTYNIGFGRNGSLDKLHAGDNSTPEGKYRVIKKISNSLYHKALLIDYPNDEDRRNFLQARKKGLIPADAGIGGLIEIHGGGKDSMTDGCVAMDNREIDHLFGLVEVGTPVTIVGAVDSRNSLSTAIESF